MTTPPLPKPTLLRNPWLRRVAAAVFSIASGYAFWIAALQGSAYITAEDTASPALAIPLAAVGFVAMLISGRGFLTYFLWPYLFWLGTRIFIASYPADLSPVWITGPTPVYFIVLGGCLTAVFLDAVIQRIREDIRESRKARGSS